MRFLSAMSKTRKKYDKLQITLVVLFVLVMAGLLFDVSSSALDAVMSPMQDVRGGNQFVDGRWSLSEETENQNIKMKTYGYSALGRPIEGYEIGDGDEVLLLFAAMHGNEKGGAELLNELINEIATRPELVSEKKKLVIIPVVNPDGYYDRADKLNVNAVNLNRNFETSGWQPGGSGDTFSGHVPFSEPESQMLKEVVEVYKPALMIAFHAKGAFVTPENGDERGRALSRWYANKSGYAFEGDNSIWDFEGTASKWFFETTGNPGITVELTTYLGSDWGINKEALLELISSNSGTSF